MVDAAVGGKMGHAWWEGVNSWAVRRGKQIMQWAEVCCLTQLQSAVYSTTGNQKSEKNIPVCSKSSVAPQALNSTTLGCTFIGCV